MSQTQIGTDEVLSSQAVRLLNTQIDETASEIASYDGLIQDTCRRIAAMDPADPAHMRELRTRTYEEQQRGEECPGVLDISSQLENLASMQRQRADLIERVRLMQVSKLRLLNDYDFPRGDDSFQKAVLGAPEAHPG